MTVSISGQMALFLLSLGAGAAFCLGYDLLSFARALLLPGKAAAVLWDVLYLLFCGAVTFFFVLARNAGEMRFFVIEGEALGLVLYLAAGGGRMGRALRAAGAGARTRAGRLAVRVAAPGVRAGRKCAAQLCKMRGITKKRSRQARKAAILRLKPARQLLYNLFHRTRTIPPESAAGKK